MTSNLSPLAFLRGINCMIIISAFLFFGSALPLYPQFDDSPVRGDGAMAERYALWAKNTMDQGLWKEALAGLERSSDFAGVSSDISYLLALARSHENSGRLSVLEALERSLITDRWNMFGPEAARLMKAENLIALKAYSEALTELSAVNKGPEEAVLTLRALVSFRPGEFRRYMTETLDRYPRETGPVRVFFDFLRNEDARGQNPGKDDLELLELIIRRLPVLVLRDGELAWIAAPFMRDSDEARRLVSAYRAVNISVPASLPAALHLGVIDDETALEELFSFPEGKASVDMALLSEIWGLLRRDETRSLFRRNLSSYTGVIIEDADRDGIFETSVEYYRGMAVLYDFDADQDGVPELTVHFEAGDPVRAQVYIPPDTSGSGETSSSRALVLWEKYPAILEVELDEARYIPRPLDFHYSPFRFIELWGSGVLFPLRGDPADPPLTRRVLVSYALRIERPSLEFSSGIEVVELNQGIPVRAREYVGDLMVSETDFLRGRPQLQWVDLDFDGRMETIRHFRRNYRPVELEYLWNYDRDFDYTLDN